MERLAHNRHTETYVLLTTFHLPENLHLDIKQLLELQPLARLLHRKRILRKMDTAECFTQTHQMVTLHNIHTDSIHNTLLLQLRNKMSNNRTQSL